MHAKWGSSRFLKLMILLLPAVIVLPAAFWLLYSSSRTEEWRSMIAERDRPSPPPGRDWHTIPFGEVPIANPLKGFVPFVETARALRGRAPLPYSMEFAYVPVNSVVKCNGSAYYFDFTHLENLLNEVAGRGHQLILRFYFDYPGLPTGVPRCLIEAGVEMRRYEEYGGGLSPDYDDPRMVKLMVELIRELGRRYDGDPRIAFIQVGLLGFWGEWHTYPHNEWFASEETQRAVLEAYDRSFNVTRLQVRYPSRVTRDYNVGFHDDSFAYATLGEVDWYFYNQLRRAGLTERWKTEPIGGEVRPEIQADVFRRADLFEHFMQCIEATHASYLLMDRLFSHPYTSAELRRAAEASRRMGYTFAVCYASVEPLPGDSVSVHVVVKNFGVAPFYYAWPVEFGIVTASGEAVYAEVSGNTVAGILPNETVVWSHVLHNVSRYCGEGRYFAVRVPNPLPKGPPIMFANEKQLPNGWLPLIECGQQGRRR
ncbi:MAG: DUF4832 domain-containing protein [Thermofilaceae archaeon]